MEISVNFSVKSALAAAFCLAACATPPAATGAQASIKAGDIAPDGTAVSCRTIDVIGTRFGERSCKSEAAWKQFDAQMAANAKEHTDKYQRVGTGSAAAGSN
jgi:hypothetical protein